MGHLSKLRSLAQVLWTSETLGETPPTLYWVICRNCVPWLKFYGRPKVVRNARGDAPNIVLRCDKSFQYFLMCCRVDN